MDREQIDYLADSFFAAIERADLDAIREIYAPDVEVWINVAGEPQGRDQSLALLDTFTSRLQGLRYEVIVRHPLPDGFVQRHVLHGRLASGEEITAPVCLLVHVADGHIQKLYEYLDGSAVASVFRR